jgi:hypothetical protein
MIREKWAEFGIRRLCFRLAYILQTLNAAKTQAELAHSKEAAFFNEILPMIAFFRDIEFPFAKH